MASPPIHGQGVAGAPPLGDEAARALRRFLHQAHVFGSAVQEVLEEKYLREASDLAISVAQFRLLKLIALGGVHQVGEVAEFLGVSSPAAVKSIDKLEAMGLVTRQASADDRRVTLLVATGHGHGLVRDYEETKARQLGPVLELVGPEQVEQLTGLLERFSTLLFGNQTVETRSCLRCAAYGDETCTLNAGDCPYKGGRGSSAAAPASLQEGER